MQSSDWDVYKAEMQKLADEAKGKLSKVRKASQYDPDQEPVKTDTGRMNMNPKTRSEYHHKICGFDDENTGRECNRPITKSKWIEENKEDPKPTNTGKMYNLPATRSTNLKKIKEEANEKAIRDRDDKKLKSDEAKAKIQGERAAMPMKEKIAEGIVAGAAVAGQTRKVVKAVNKGIGHTRIAKEMAVTGKKIGKGAAGKKTAAAPKRTPYNPNIRGAGPTNTKNYGSLTQKNYGSLVEKRELPTGQKDMSALSSHNGSPFSVGEAKNPLGDKKSVSFGTTKVSNPLGSGKRTPPFAVGQSKNPFGDRKYAPPFAVGMQKGSPFGARKSYNPLGR